MPNLLLNYYGKNMSKEKLYNNYSELKKYKTWAWRYKKAFNFIKPKSKILDIGCGNGILDGHLIKLKQCNVWGFDIDEVSLKAAKKKKVSTYKIDIESENWPKINNKFDYVICLEILEHLYFPEKLLAKIRLMTKYAIFSYANASFWKYRLQFLLGKIPSHAPFKEGEHLWHWNYIKFKKLIETNGFEIINEKLSGEIPIINKLIPSKLKKKLINKFPNLLTYGMCFLAKSKNK